MRRGEIPARGIVHLTQPSNAHVSMPPLCDTIPFSCRGRRPRRPAAPSASNQSHLGCKSSPFLVGAEQTLRFLPAFARSEYPAPISPWLQIDCIGGGCSSPSANCRSCAMRNYIPYSNAEVFPLPPNRPPHSLATPHLELFLGCESSVKRYAPTPPLYNIVPRRGVADA